MEWDFLQVRLLVLATCFVLCHDVVRLIDFFILIDSLFEKVLMAQHSAAARSFVLVSNVSRRLGFLLWLNSDQIITPSTSKLHGWINLTRVTLASDTYQIYVESIGWSQTARPNFLMYNIKALISGQFLNCMNWVYKVYTQLEWKFGGEPLQERKKTLHSTLDSSLATSQLSSIPYSILFFVGKSYKLLILLYFKS